MILKGNLVILFITGCILIRFPVFFLQVFFCYLIQAFKIAITCIFLKQLPIQDHHIDLHGFPFSICSQKITHIRCNLCKFLLIQRFIDHCRIEKILRSRPCHMPYQGYCHSNKKDHSHCRKEIIVFQILYFLLPVHFRPFSYFGFPHRFSSSQFLTFFTFK